MNAENHESQSNIANYYESFLLEVNTLKMKRRKALVLNAVIAAHQEDALGVDRIRALDPVQGLIPILIQVTKEDPNQTLKNPSLGKTTKT